MPRSKSSKRINPFSSKGQLNYPLFDDVSARLELSSEPLRVELRRIQDPHLGPVNYEKKVVGEESLVGILDEPGLPTEGEFFRLSYHSHNGSSDFGIVESSSPVDKVVYSGVYIYFQTPEGFWRLELLDSGN